MSSRATRARAASATPVRSSPRLSQALPPTERRAPDGRVDFTDSDIEEEDEPAGAADADASSSLGHKRLRGAERVRAIAVQKRARAEHAAAIGVDLAFRQSISASSWSTAMLPLFVKVSSLRKVDCTPFFNRVASAINERDQYNAVDIPAVDDMHYLGRMINAAQAGEGWNRAAVSGVVHPGTIAEALRVGGVEAYAKTLISALEKFRAGNPHKEGATCQLVTLLLQATGFMGDARIETRQRDVTFSLGMNNRDSLSQNALEGLEAEATPDFTIQIPSYLAGAPSIVVTVVENAAATMEAVLPQALAQAIAAAQENLTIWLNRGNFAVDTDPRVNALSDAVQEDVAKRTVAVFIMLVQGTKFQFYRVQFTGKYLLQMTCRGEKPLGDIEMSRLHDEVPVPAAAVAIEASAAAAEPPASTQRCWEFDLADRAHRPALLKALYNLREKLRTM